jgi:ATP-dependent DNA helicase DinG
MISIEQEIEQAFPFSEFRPGQQEAMERILAAFRSGKKYVLLDGPTGFGKSPVGIALARIYKSAFYLTSTKILQDQIMRDFAGLGVVDLKGRNAYECTVYDLNPSLKAAKPQAWLSCADGLCKRQGKSRCDFCFQGTKISCPYFAQLEKAKMAPLTVMNFSSFFFQSLVLDERFPRRGLMVIDEAHNTESQIMSFVSVNLVDGALDLKVPTSGTAEDYAKWMEQERLVSLLGHKIKQAKQDGRVEEAEEWGHTLYKIVRFLDSDPKEWVAEYSTLSNRTGLGKAELKPIFANKHAHQILFNRADRFLLMSATIISPEQTCEALGINPDEMEYIEVPSRFPVKNRPIFFDSSVGSMSFKKRDETMPRLLARIEKICSEHHAEHRGIIHTHSFLVSDYIVENASDSLRERLCYQRDYQTREDALRALALSENGILIGPAWHEGLDLKDDMGRFSIICKVPYPNYMNNPQLKARMDLSQEYYDYITALKLVQSYGRTVRSEEDWAITYILDADFARFMGKSRHLLPGWFLEAVEGS